MDTQPCRWTYEEIWTVLIDTQGARKLVVLDGDYDILGVFEGKGWRT
jgi:hypothetical protein